MQSIQIVKEIWIAVYFLSARTYKNKKKNLKQ